MIIDGYGRLHNYLRISLTDNCNLRCFYCMPEEDYDFTPNARLMQADEILELAKIFVAQGVIKIRLTGGEPLVRKDAGAILLALSQLPVALTITSNGTRIHHFLDQIKSSRMHSVNISLDTLDPAKFQLITRRDHFSQVINNIQLLLQNGLQVKVNMVVMKGLNELEMLDFVEWTRHNPIDVRFIEFMPFSGNRWSGNKVFTLQDMLAFISTKYDFEQLPEEKHATAKKFKVPGFRGSFSVISTMSANFCGDCNRIRLTADGKMKNCLFSGTETDLLTPFREGKNILPLIQQSIASKARELGGQFGADFMAIHPEDIHNRSMITIGG